MNGTGHCGWRTDRLKFGAERAIVQVEKKERGHAASNRKATEMSEIRWNRVVKINWKLELKRKERKSIKLKK